MKMRIMAWFLPVIVVSVLAGGAGGFLVSEKLREKRDAAAVEEAAERSFDIDEEVRRAIEEEALKNEGILPEENVKDGEEATADASSRGSARKADGTASEKTAGEPPPPPLAVENVTFDGDDEIRIELSQRPDMDVVRQYVTVEPMNEGVPTFRYTTPRGRHPTTGNYIPTLIVSGDFAYSTNVTLRIRKGFPMHGSVLEATSLQEDCEYTFKRDDRDAVVDFADAGRYLPPMGSREIALKSVNVPKIEVAVQKIPAANVVAMLALEEGAYKNISKSWVRNDSERDEFTTDLGAEPVISTITTPEIRNKEIVTRISLSEPSCLVPGASCLADNGANDETNGEATPTPQPSTLNSQPTTANGLYVVRASIAGLLRDDDWWYARGSNQYRFRLICVSDLGLSVRKVGGDGSLLVWLNSFTTGKPVENAEIAVYSPANVLVAKGRTDATGLCRPDRIAPGEAFAVVATTADGADSTFIALRSSMEVDETYPEGGREEYLKDGEATTFVWSDRGIYRHDEKIFLHAILRGADGNAPQPFPVDVILRNPSDNIYARRTIVSDENGSVVCEDFCVPADQPSGLWECQVLTPGKDGKLLGSRTIKIEEFAPPQIRVAVEAKEMPPQDFEFTVGAENLYGGAAKGLVCEGAVVFEDAPFAPAEWKSYRFGNSDRGLKPSFRRLKKDKLDDTGHRTFAAPLWAASGLPKAAVRATAQGTVFEDGGRPASTRKSVICHLYPYYIGTTLTGWMKRPTIGFPQVDVACVLPDGRRVADPRRLVAKIERIENVYAYRRNARGWATWDCERVRSVVADKISVPSLPDGDTVLTLPIKDSGEYVLTIDDLESDVSFSMQFYLGESGDDAVRSSLAQPTAVSVTPDKAFYRVGETPRLMVKSPFTGTALVTVLRDALVYREVVALTNATTCLTLPAAAKGWSPSVDVEVSVIQAVKPGSGHFAVRAHGETVIVVRPEEREIPVKVEAGVELGDDGCATVTVEVGAEGGGALPEDATAIVTLVDEGINILTDEAVPDPIGHFAASRTSNHPLYDLYHRLLPVLDDDALMANGVKTGGGFGAEMLSRVSPVPSRRFKPLALWQTGVKDKAVFTLPEFVGEVRVTAVVLTGGATGAAAVHRKVAPKIVAQPDAPRFAAPGDVFDVTLPISNRSGDAADVAYSIAVDGPAEIVGEKTGAMENLAKDDSIVRSFRVKATGIGEAALKFMVSGAGENHVKTILLPVRPACAWQETAGVDMVCAGETKAYDAIPAYARRSFKVSGSRIAELCSALEWLADYPHGCLEQTSSRIFPLITAGGILSALESKAASNRVEYVEAGVRRVESMVRYSDFVMWPDCNYAPWDRETSLYAAHFLVEAEKNGVTLNAVAKSQVMKFLKTWAMAKDNSVSAYACHTLALAGTPEKDRMLRLYDARAKLKPLDRARLARAFTAIDDRPRAKELLAFATAPESVKEAAFSLLALLELDRDDDRIPSLVVYLTNMRDAKTFSWGTTASNAHALLALGEYYRGREGAKTASAKTPNVEKIENADGTVRFVNSGDSDAFVSWRKLDVPLDPKEAVRENSGPLEISRRFLDPDGNEVDLANLSRGDLVFVEITLHSSEPRSYNDLIVEDLFPAAFEPVHGEVASSFKSLQSPGWVMRTDARDDRMLTFSKRFSLNPRASAFCRYPVRVITAGEFILPAASVEAMYSPEIHASTPSSRICVK